MSVGAVASDDQVRIGDVALVILGIDIDTVPARRKHEFSTDAIRAIGVNVVLGGQEVTVQRTLSILSVVKAIEADGALSQIVLVGLAQTGPLRLGRVRLLVGVIADSVVAAVGITSDHAETDREGRNSLVATGSRVEEVIAAASVSTTATKDDTTFIRNVEIQTTL